MPDQFIVRNDPLSIVDKCCKEIESFTFASALFDNFQTVSSIKSIEFLFLGLPYIFL